MSGAGGAEGVLITLFFGLAISLIHLALTPITLTLFAGLKTVFDYGTRVYTTDENKLQAINQSIMEMDNEQILQLTNNLLEHKNPSSSSSAKLFKVLSEKRDQANKLYNDAVEIEQTKYQQTLKPETLPKLDEVRRDQIIQETRLDKNALNEIPKIKQLKNTLKHEKSSIARGQILNYMQKEKNNGKKMFQIVVNFFDQKQKSDPAAGDNVSVSPVR